MSTIGDESTLFWVKSEKGRKVKKWKSYFFSSYFQLISMRFHSNFRQDHSSDGKFNSTSNKYAHDILLVDPTPHKMRNTWKNVMVISAPCFLMYFSFFPPKVCHVCTCWMYNWIPHPTSSLAQNLRETTRR